MRAASVFCVVLGGCGFHSNSLIDSGGPGGSDGSATGSDGSGGGSDGSGSDTGGTATDCLQHWIDHTPSVSKAQEITALSSGGDDRDPWISMDGLRLYFVRAPGSQGKEDIYLSTRTASQDFMSASAVVNLDRSDSNEERPALSQDEKILVMASDRPPPGAPPPVPRFQVLIVSRPDTTTDFGTPMPDDPRVVLINADAIDHLDPFVTGDGLELWLSPAVGPQGRQEIRVATRANLLLDFTAAGPVTELNTMTSSADPALSLDKRIIVFTAKMGNQDTDLYYATRPGATGAFGTPVPVPVANSDSNDGDPMLSADGCVLYFASQRNRGKYHLFRSQIAK